MTADHHASRGQSEDIRARKVDVPGVYMTAYTTPMAKSLHGYRDFLLVGLFADLTAQFVKQCPDWGVAMRDAAFAYAEDVWSDSFPSLERSSG